MRPTRRGVLAAVGALVAAGCTTGGPGSGSGVDSTTDTTTTTTPSDGDDSSDSGGSGDGTTRTTSTPAPEPSVTPESALGWTRAFDAPVALGPAAADGTLYVGTDDGVLYAFAPDGTERWTADVGGSFYGGSGDDASPVVADGTVYLTTGAQAGVLGEGFTLFALDAADGSERWHWALESSRFLSLLGVAGGRVYAATSNDYLQPSGETLYAFDTAGTEQWTAETGDPREAGVDPEAVAVVPYGALQVIGADGTERFRSDRFRDVAGEPTFVDGRLLVASDGEPGGLYALDSADGTEQWTVREFVNSLVVGDRAYVGGETVAAYGFDGRQAWDSGIEAFVEARHGDLVYASTFVEGGGAEAIALSAADGAVRWRHPVEAETAEAAAVDDRLAVLSLQGVPAIEAVDPETGERRVRFEIADHRGLSPPTVLDGRAFVADGSTLYALAP